MTIRDTDASVPAPLRFPVTTVIIYSDVIFSSPEIDRGCIQEIFLVERYVISLHADIFEEE